MSELIDREALKDAVKRYAGEPTKEKDRKCQAICLDTLGTIDAQPAASPWHRVEETPENACDCLVCWTTIHDEETGEVTGHGFWCEKGWYETGGVLEDGFYCQNRVEIHPVRVEPDYWMPIEPPKEDE